MQILSVLLLAALGSFAMAAPAADKRACALTDYECMAATYGPTKPGDAGSQPDKPIHQEPDFDSNRNWGIVEQEVDEEEEDEGDGGRPISFEPIKPKRPISRPPPPVEHGTEQGNNA